MTDKKLEELMTVDELIESQKHYIQETDIDDLCPYSIVRLQHIAFDELIRRARLTEQQQLNIIKELKRLEYKMTELSGDMMLISDAGDALPDIELAVKLSVIELYVKLRIQELRGDNIDDLKHPILEKSIKKQVEEVIIKDELKHRARLINNRLEYQLKSDVIKELMYIKNILCQTAWCERGLGNRISSVINERIKELLNEN